jgi:DNA gyrase subunit A
MKVSDISSQGRATQGVKLIRIDEGDAIAAITKIDVTEVEEINGTAPTGETTNLTENPSEGEDPNQL